MNAVVKELDRIRRYCAKPGWNGYGAHEISIPSWDNAKRLAETVFATMPPHHVGIDNLTGHVSFQWGDLRRRSLTLYIGTNVEDAVSCLNGVAGQFSRRAVRVDAPELLREVEACR